MCLEKKVIFGISRIMNGINQSGTVVLIVIIMTTALLLFCMNFFYTSVYNNWAGKEFEIVVRTELLVQGLLYYGIALILERSVPLSEQVYQKVIPAWPLGRQTSYYGVVRFEYLAPTTIQIRATLCKNNQNPISMQCDVQLIDHSLLRIDNWQFFS